MNLDDAFKVAAILDEADSGCLDCAAALARRAKEAFPEFDWDTLLREAKPDMWN